MNYRCFYSVGIVVLAFAVSSCCKRPNFEERRESARLVRLEDAWYHNVEYNTDRLVDELNSISRQIDHLRFEMNELEGSVALLQRGYYSSSESESVMHLYVRYLVIREALWDIVMRSSDFSAAEDEALRHDKLTVSLAAATLLLATSSEMIESYLEDDSVIQKLNEGNHVHGLPRYAYRSIFLQITSLDNLDLVEGVFSLFEREYEIEASALRQRLDSKSNLTVLSHFILKLYPQARERIEGILERKALVFPQARNWIRHTQVGGLAREGMDQVEDSVYLARSMISEGIGNVRVNSTSREVDITDAQHQALKAALEPGDVILTYSNGYMSNIFLPGVFKHGITYVGSPEDRGPLNLEEEWKGAGSREKQRDYLAALKKTELKDGSDADVIEAVSEGVIFNSLKHVLSHHVERFVVIRPILKSSERQRQLSQVFAMLGGLYDYRFDFVDGSSQCCTEVIYRSLHDVGSIKLKLIERIGTQTLGAEDLLSQALEAGDDQWGVVSLGVASKAGEETKIYFGAEAKAALLDLVNQ